jgi:hypothetical protein
MNGSEVLPNLRAHYTAFFEGHALTEHRRRVGPIASIVPEFTVVRVAPGPKTRFWTYLSLGASLAPHGDARLEFLFLAPFPSDRMVDLLAWSVHYHYGHQLGLGHTMPIGEPWLSQSSCDHLLVSRPYPLGPGLEVCPLTSGHAHVFWLVPITEAERNYKRAHGTEALETLFEERGLQYWAPDRESLVLSEGAG